MDKLLFAGNACYTHEYRNRSTKDIDTNYTGIQWFVGRINKDLLLDFEIQEMLKKIFLDSEYNTKHFFNLRSRVSGITIDAIYNVILHNTNIINEIPYYSYMADHVRPFFDNIRTYIEFLLAIDDITLKENILRADSTIFVYMYKNRITTWDKLLAYRYNLKEVGFKFIEDYCPNKNIQPIMVGNPIYSCTDIQYINKTKKGFDGIRCFVVTHTELRRQELKEKWMPSVRNIITETLKKQTIFKNNPYLLNHLKIENMYYNDNGLITVMIGWKESFAYAEAIVDEA